MTKLWVKLKPNDATQVPTNDCTNVDDFKEACKKKLSPLLDNIPPSRLSLSLTDGGEALQPDDPLPAQNTARNSLFITVLTTSGNLQIEQTSRLDKLEEIVNNYFGKAETIQISDLNIEILQKDGYTCIGQSVLTPDTLGFDVPEKFKWLVPEKEHDKKNTDGYLAYMKNICNDFRRLVVTTNIEAPNLNTIVGVNPHHLNGKADLYVKPTTADLICRNQLCMVLEMKPNAITSNNLAQAIGYVIAANSLFDVPNRPSPVGVLSDFIDQWHLIWVGADGRICYASYESDSAGNKKALTRGTAIYYIRKHLERYNKLLLHEENISSKGKKRPVEEPTNWAFGELQAGVLKKQRLIESEDRMHDFIETDEEMMHYEMMKKLKNSTFFADMIPPSAEHLSYFN